MPMNQDHPEEVTQGNHPEPCQHISYMRLHSDLYLGLNIFFTLAI